MVDGVDKFLRRYPDSPVVEEVLGTLDPGEIRARVHGLDPEVTEIFYFAASVGALFGVRRRDGDRVAIKVHGRFRDEEYLEQMQAVQEALADAGFPAPRPLGREAFVTWEQWIDDGEFRDAHEPEVRGAMARTLVRLHDLATATGVRPRRRFFPLGEGELWPVPHNALFDFEATTAGAEWIDEIARAAKAIRDLPIGREVVGHGDWSAKHFRFDPELRPTVLYDWDSLNTDREPSLVGTAAASFTYTEELPVDVWPSLEEVRAFVDDYEAARDGPFTEDERRGAYAGAVYLSAYAMRCGHSLGGPIDPNPLTQLAEALL